MVFTATFASAKQVATHRAVQRATMREIDREADGMLPNCNVNQSENEVAAIEFFAGIGGFAAAWPEASITASIDIHQTAARVHSANFNHPFWVREIESIAVEELLKLDANLWWMSPPCQPYTKRGNQADTADARARSFLRLIDLIAECAPDFIALENVGGFANSIAREQLQKRLQHSGYRWQSIELCPTEMGWPNKRPRFYLLASRQRPIAAWRELPRYRLRLAELAELRHELQPAASELEIDSSTLSRIESAIDRCELNGERPTACFASSYGRVLLNSGSYLRVEANRYRRFSPREVANLLGFPATFKLPSDIPTRSLWKLLGNSLSLPAVRYILSHLPDGPTPELPWLQKHD